MLAVAAGVVLMTFGACLLTNLWGLADRLFDRLSHIEKPGTTAGTYRLMGGVMGLVGLLWTASGLTELL